MFVKFVDCCEAICYIALAFCICFLVIETAVRALKDVVSAQQEASIKRFIFFYQGETTGKQLEAESLFDLLKQFAPVFELVSKDFVVYSVPDFDNENVSDWVFEGIFNKDGERIY